MLDVSFWELVVIGAVALIVIGPDKLPAVARTLGYWFGKTRRFVAAVQEDFQREIAKTEELKRLLEEQSRIKGMHEIIEQTVDETRKSVSTGAQLAKPDANSPEEEQTPDPERPSQNTPARLSINTSQPSGSRSTPPADHVNEQAK